MAEFGTVTVPLFAKVDDDYVEVGTLEVPLKGEVVRDVATGEPKIIVKVGE